MQTKRMAKTGIAAVAGFLTLLAPAYAASMSKGRPSGRDKSFMKSAAEGGMAEVELGRLAAQKSADPDVKAFGQRMVDDHSRANEKLKELAASLHYPLPTGLKASDRREAHQFAALSGADFDHAYVKEMVKDHQGDVKEFEKEATHGNGPVRSFASDTLPTLREHLRMAQEMAAKMGGAAGRRSRR